MAFLKVNPNEWKKARAFFAGLSKQQISKDPKFNRKTQKGIQHSFLKINGEIVALANRKVDGILGKGSYGLAKIAQNQNGKAYTIKIEKGGLRKPDNDELLAMKQVNYYHGEVTRKSKKKRYTLQTYVDGTQLKLLINQKLSYTQKLIVAIKCCQSIQNDFHAKRVIHGDIKSANFVGKIQGQDIQVKAIDFGYSLVLPENSNIRTYRCSRGTEGFTAPEILSRKEFSFSSDVYALGSLMRKSLRLPGILSKQMIHVQSNKRCSLESAIATLVDKLKSRKDLEPPAFQLIKAWETEQKSKPKVKSAPIYESKKNNVKRTVAALPRINHDNKTKSPAKLLVVSYFAILIAGCTLLPLSQGLILGLSGCLVGLAFNKVYQKGNDNLLHKTATTSVSSKPEESVANEHPPQKHFLPHRKKVSQKETIKVNKKNATNKRIKKAKL